MKAELIDVLKVGNTLGESVTWDARTGCLWWTDIQESKLYRLHYESRDVQKFTLPERLASLGLTENPDTLICAFASGFSFYTPSTGMLQAILPIEASYSGTRLNDGRLDPCGRFFAGTMTEGNTGLPDDGCSLYSIVDGKVTKHFSDIKIANGLSWNRTGDKAYFADSPKQTIWTFDYDTDAGTLSNRQVFATTKGHSYPDGATVDSTDHYWSAKWGASKATRYTPDGQVDFEIPVDAPHVSCLTFGGPNMDILFVTSAKHELSSNQLDQAPNSGHLFIYQTDIKGIKLDNYYKNQ